jgi:hypothetical protein
MGRHRGANDQFAVHKSAMVPDIPRREPPGVACALFCRITAAKKTWRIDRGIQSLWRSAHQRHSVDGPKLAPPLKHTALRLHFSDRFLVRDIQNLHGRRVAV